MSSKRRARERKRQEDGPAAPRGLIRRSRELGGRRFGWPVLLVVAAAFVLWLVFDLIGVHR